MTKTKIKPYLFLNRLIVFSKTGKPVYDENFHHGVNIIRGENSSGKSTISNFIFYVLGGDFNNWTTEALTCDYVVAEVEINEAILTIRRNINESSRQNMSFFWGVYEEAKKSAFDGWMTFPYQQTENKSSYSTVLFNMLDFPEVRSDEDSKITFHQVLRLLYIDQDSPVQSLFRFERFDPPLTRQAISELLLGVYDDSLYHDRLNLRSNQKELGEKRREFESINKVFSSTGKESKLSNIHIEIEQANKALNELRLQISELKTTSFILRNKRTPLKVEVLLQDLTPLKQSVTGIKNAISSYEVEIYDSELFIDTLQKRVSALNNSILTREALGELPLTHCPQCLNLLNKEHLDSQCFLCKQPLTQSEEQTHAKRIKQELELQIKESSKLLEGKKKRLSNLKAELPIVTQKARLLQKDLDVAIQGHQSTRDENIDSLLVQQGVIETNIESLTQQIKAVELLELLRVQIAELEKQNSILETNIQLKTGQQNQKYTRAINKIEEYTKYILRHDLKRQDEFENPQKVEIDFLSDVFNLGGKYNFSASSNTYFKNAIRYSVFFSSLDLSFYRYPKFILCDNMEDKGMELIRTQNLQRIIVSISESKQVEHQIIFSTSMIASDLDTRHDLCVGPHYTRENKTLKL